MSDSFIIILRKLLRPVIRFCLRRSVRIQDITAALKLEMIILATQELEQHKEPFSISRISAMTGLQRKELSSLLSLLEKKPTHTVSNGNIITRIIGQWLYDRRFVRKDGLPRVLDTEGINSDFAKLVRSISTDLNHHTILFELERLNFIDHVNGRAKLLTIAYSNRSNEIEVLHDAAIDIEDLYRSAEHNIIAKAEDLNLHARTTFDNIPLKDIPRLRQWLLNAGSVFHRKASQYLSQFDRDIAPPKASASDTDQGQGRITIGTFSLTEKAPLREGRTNSRKKR